MNPTGAASALTDDLLQSLLLPINSGAIAVPADGSWLFLRARTGIPVQALDRTRLDCEQSFKPFADALERDGFTVGANAHDYPLVLVLPPRQREEARALLANALIRVAPGGTLVAAMANSEGARSGEADLARLAGPVRSLSKHKCRVFWVRPTPDNVDAALRESWAALDAPRPIADGRFVSRPGLFAWDRIDPASALLAAQLPDDLCGRGADLGAGFGYLAHHVLTRCPAVTAMDLFEAQSRALELARINLAGFADRVALGFHWHDVTTGIGSGYDFIVTNPPFHIDRYDQPGLGRAFIVAAGQALRPGGRLFLVANRHLPYEAALGEGFGEVRTRVQSGGFKVIEAVKGRAGGRTGRRA